MGVKRRWLQRLPDGSNHEACRPRHEHPAVLKKLSEDPNPNVRKTATAAVKRLEGIQHPSGRTANSAN